MPNGKLYDIEVLERQSHGRCGKTVLAKWCLSGTSKKAACDFASEIVAGMTWRAILTESEEYGHLCDFVLR